MSTMDSLQENIHQLAVDKGWWEDGREFPEVAALVHSEISEALEEWRQGRNETYIGPDGKPEGVFVELADAVIRIMDFFGYYGESLEQHILTKHAFNQTRPHRHGGKKA